MQALDAVPTRRSVATRAKLISVAERLFAERSIEGVSLNEISKAAAQRNSNVCQYHFGDKQGLLQAILDKHVPGIAAAREVMLGRLQGSPSRRWLRPLAEALVRPVAAKLHDADGGREFIRINAQLIALHTLSVRGVPASTMRLAHADRFTRALQRALRAAAVPGPVARNRGMLAAVLVFHGLDDYSRLLDAAGERRATVDIRLFVANLEDAVVALLSAAVSAGTGSADGSRRAREIFGEQ
ncbi:TetR/AcrR family transcriptional regulator [Steroidobacter denitrificans]|uniref:TetR/AcrR family transcriptional regulator n=1 Tax=Steroidobacter denitrificans TaxID=465721 RepID=UPI00082DE69B|nr:TetR family transcriptional regulator [Steroidobacter denitrificans]